MTVALLRPLVRTLALAALSASCASASAAESPSEGGQESAVLMQGRNLESVGINVYDAVAGDNTTAYGYGYLKGQIGGRMRVTVVLPCSAALRISRRSPAS